MLDSNSEDSNPVITIPSEIYQSETNFSTKHIKEDDLSESEDAKLSSEDAVAVEMSSVAFIKPKKYVCEFPGCNLRFSRPSRLENHSRIHTGDRPFVCEHCKKSYTRNAHLKRHLETNHSSAPDTKVLVHAFLCSTCNKSFSLKQNLQRHVKRTHSAGYKCDKCDAVFNKNSLLKKHGVVHGATTKLMPCSQCERLFASQSKLRKHKRVHDGYKCDVCEVVMNTWSDLTMHKKSHLNEPTELMTCDICEKQFSKRYLKMHMQVHSETRDVLHCTELYCPRYFYFMRNLKQHIYTFHLGIKHSCTQPGCDAEMSSKQKLKQHVKAMHSDQPKEVKPRKPARPRKDRGTFKKPMVAIMTRLEPDNPSSLINQTKKKPLENLDNIRREGKDYVGSTLETSDSEGYSYIGCRRAFAKPDEDRVRDPTSWLKHAYDDDNADPSDLEPGEDPVMRVDRLPAGMLTGDFSSDTEDTDRAPEELGREKVDFSPFIKQS